MRHDKRCYACEFKATTREHVPPKAFSPDGFRDGLVTVPSCDRHNLDNSMDVEYARNVIASSRGINQIGERLVFGKAKRSYDRSCRLFSQTFRDSGLAALDGEETCVIRIDLRRLKSVMTAIAQAIFFLDEERKAERWRVYVDSLCSNADLGGARHGGAREQLRSTLGRLTFKDRPVPQPKVFKYAVSRMAEGLPIYRFDFYEGFVAYAWPYSNILRRGFQVALVN